MHYTELKNQNEHYKIMSSPEQTIVEYDYKMPNGDLFSCKASSLEEAKEKRNEWITIKYKNQKIIQQKIIFKDSFLSKNLLVREIEKVKNSCTTLVIFTISKKDELINECCNRWDLIFDYLIEAYGLDIREYDFITIEKNNENYIIIGEELHENN